MIEYLLTFQPYEIDICDDIFKLALETGNINSKILNENVKMLNLLISHQQVHFTYALLPTIPKFLLKSSYKSCDKYDSLSMRKKLHLCFQIM